MNTHEYLSFNKPISNAEIADRICTYYAKWLESLSENDFEELKIELVVDGASISSISEMEKALQNLGGAESFSIDVLAMSLDDEDAGNLYDFLDEIKSSEAVTYKFMSFSEKYAEFKGWYIADGEAGSFLNKSAEKSLLEAQMNWYSWGCSLWADFDFDKQKNVIDKLHEIVRKYLPKDQIAFAEEDWTGVNDDPGALVSDLQWIVSDLKNVAGFSDEVNTALEALDGDYQINAEGLWFDLEQFAVARWQVVDKKLQLVSVKL